MGNLFVNYVWFFSLSSSCTIPPSPPLSPASRSGPTRSSTGEFASTYKNQEGGGRILFASIPSDRQGGGEKFLGSQFLCVDGGLFSRSLWQTGRGRGDRGRRGVLKNPPSHRLLLCFCPNLYSLAGRGREGEGWRGFMVISLFRRKGKSWQGNLFYFPLVKILAEGAGVDMGELKKGRKEEDLSPTHKPSRGEEKNLNFPYAYAGKEKE